MRRFSVRILAVFFLVLLAAGPGCVCGGTPLTDAGVDDAERCIVNSDCGEDAHCADGFCVDGLPPGSCRTEADCQGDEICLTPDGSDIGACINPHDCDDDDDCDNGQVCEDANDDGFRDCIFPGCGDDDECAIELAGQCGDADEPRCVARECVCRDRCGAPCGEDRQCCGLEGTTATCIDDLGPCGTFSCEPGFAGQASSFDDWSVPLCGYDNEVCACAELPPIPFGALGNAHVLRTAPDGTVVVVAYNETYGDVVVAPVVDGVVGTYVFVDGVPAVSSDAPIVGGPSGPRGGVVAPGDDVGRALDAVFSADGMLHIVARDDTHRTLRLLTGPVSGPFEATVIDDVGEPGHGVRAIRTADDTLVVSAVARRTASSTSELRVYGAALPVDGGTVFGKKTVSSVLLSSVDCEGGCEDDEVCAAAVAPALIATCLVEADNCATCPSGQACTTQGCRLTGDKAPLAKALAVDALALVEGPSGVVVLGHDGRAGALIGHRQTGGDVVTGTATFATSTVAPGTAADVGNRPAAIRDGATVLVLSADVSNRTMSIRELGATLSVLSETFVDDGERVHSSGAIDNHAVDVATLAKDGTGRMIVAWQDGTDGAVRARVRTSAGVLGPAQTVVGGTANATYAGTYGLSLSSTGTDDELLVSSRHLWLAADPPVSDIVVVNEFLQCPDDDIYEDNDDAASARQLATPATAVGIICGVTDDDHYSVTVGADCTVTAELIFDHDDGDLDLRLTDGNDVVIENSASVADIEVVSGTFAAAGTGVLRVIGFQSAENAYVLRVDVDCQ